MPCSACHEVNDLEAAKSSFRNHQRPSVEGTTCSYLGSGADLRQRPLSATKEVGVLIAGTSLREHRKVYEASRVPRATSGVAGYALERTQGANGKVKNFVRGMEHSSSVPSNLALPNGFCVAA